MSKLTELIKAYESGWKAVTRNGEVKQVTSKLYVGQWSARIKQDLNSRLKFNDLTMLAEIDGQPIKGEELENIYIELNERGWDISDKDAKKGFLNAAKVNRYHPVQDYLTRIENDPNVVAADINKLSSIYLKTEKKLYDSMLAACLIGDVQRAFQHGCQMDYLLTLKGKQGIGKSTFWRTLAGEWFCDSYQESDKDLRLAIGTCWMFEIQELETMTARSVAGKVKALITTREDVFRPPYGSVTEKFPRTSIFVGSVNSDDFLRDETGSRRFWVIEVTERVDIERLRKDRDSIWKAAVIAWRSGRKPNLEDQELILSESLNSGYESEHPFQEPLFNWLKTECGEFTAHAAIIGSGIRTEDKVTDRDLRQCHVALRRLGYEPNPNQKRIGKTRVRLWRKSQ